MGRDYTTGDYNADSNSIISKHDELYIIMLYVQNIIVHTIEAYILCYLLYCVINYNSITIVPISSVRTRYVMIAGPLCANYRFNL